MASETARYYGSSVGTETDCPASGRVVCPMRPTAIPRGDGPDREARALLARIIGIAVAVLVIVWIISDPASAGNTVHSWITGIITFFHHLA